MIPEFATGIMLICCHDEISWLLLEIEITKQDVVDGELIK